MFASVEDFGLSILLVILDNHLQSFFEMISEMEDVTAASSQKRSREAGTEAKSPETVTNPERQHEWEVTAGKVYSDFYPKGSHSNTGWPRLNVL
jgi:hypothetical protein